MLAVSALTAIIVFRLSNAVLVTLIAVAQIIQVN